MRGSETGRATDDAGTGRRPLNGDVCAPCPWHVSRADPAVVRWQQRSRGQCGLGDRARADHQAGCLTPPDRAHEAPDDRQDRQHHDITTSARHVKTGNHGESSA